MNKGLERFRQLMRKKRTWLVLGSILAAIIAAYFFIPALPVDQSAQTGSNLPLSGIIIITLLGCMLLIVITALLIKDHHLYRTENDTNDKQKDYLQQLKKEEDFGVIIANAAGMITYMNRLARQVTGYNSMEQKNRMLDDIYQLDRESVSHPKRVWKAIPDGSGMMTEKEVMILIGMQGVRRRISQQVFHFFDNRGDMKEKVITFIPDTSPGTDHAGSSGPSQAADHYAVIARANGDLCWEWDIERCVMTCFAGHTSMFGHELRHEEDIRQWWKANIHPEDVQNVLAFYAKAIEQRRTFVQQEYRFRCGDGKFKHILDRATVICNDKGEAVKLAGVMQDITPLKLEEKRLAEAVLNAQEAERKSIGEELHDNINQILGTSLLHLGMIQEQAQQPDKVIELVKLAKGHTMKAVNEIRKLSHELSPVYLDDTNLEEYIQDLLSNFNADNRFEIDFNVDSRLRESLTDEMQLHFYRILQEQLKNIRTHAEADKIFISMSVQQNIAELVITDNGKGFDALKPSKGIGLSNIKRRGHSMGGCMRIKSEPGKGCQLRIKVPLEK